MKTGTAKGGGTKAGTAKGGAPGRYHEYRGSPGSDGPFQVLKDARPREHCENLYLYSR